ncbi:winged helix-turn-helix transcriptional regulator [Shimia sp. W99]
MTAKPYGLICPISKACEVLQARWTLPILCEIWAGETRFNDIRRALGGISPTVLSRRLSELEATGMVERIEDPAKGSVDYLRTQKAVDLEPALIALAHWAQANIEADVALSYEVSTLMWKMRKMDVSKVPARRIVVRFHFSDADEAHEVYWLLLRPGFPVEVCVDVPGFEVDLYVETTTESFGAVIMGRSTLAREEELGRMYVSGDAALKRTLPDWFPKSKHSTAEGIAMLP